MKKSNKILAGVIAGLVLTLGGVGAAACTSKNQEKASAFNNAFNYSAIGGIELLKGVEQINKINLSATESRAISALTALYLMPNAPEILFVKTCVKATATASAASSGRGIDFNFKRVFTIC